MLGGAAAGVGRLQVLPAVQHAHQPLEAAAVEVEDAVLRLARAQHQLAAAGVAGRQEHAYRAGPACETEAGASRGQSTRGSRTLMQEGEAAEFRSRETEITDGQVSLLAKSSITHINTHSARCLLALQRRGSARPSSLV